MQEDFQLSRISRRNAWKAKFQWSPIDSSMRKEEMNKNKRKTVRLVEGRGRAKGVEFLILTKHSQHEGLEGKRKEEEPGYVQAPQKIISGGHTYP